MPEEIDDFEELDDDFAEMPGDPSPNTTTKAKNDDNVIPFRRKEDKSQPVETTTETGGNTDNIIQFPGNPNSEGSVPSEKNGYQRASSGREAYERKLDNKNYYSDKKNETEKKQEQNKRDIKDNKEKQDANKKRLDEVKSKKQQYKRGPDNRTKEEKKEDKEEAQEAKKEQKDLKKEGNDLKKQNKQSKLDLKSIAKDKRKAAAYQVTHPVEAMTIKLIKLAKKAIRWILMTFGPLILGVLLIVFCVYMLLGPLMDVWKAFDTGVRSVANGVEKFTNFYRGFGFEDSKTAFYNELKKVDEYYNYKLDLPLLLSTVFYPESSNYDTSYQEHMEVVDGDPITSFLSGGPAGFYSYFTKWCRDILKESGNTYDDETGLTYNAGKIYRMRRLAMAMCDVDNLGTLQTVSLEKFIKDMGVVEELKNIILSAAGGILKTLVDTVITSVETVVYVISGQFDKIPETWEEYWNRLCDIVGEVKNSVMAILSIVSFGLCRISKISWTLTGVKVSYYPVKVNMEKYDNYVKNYYFKDNPEYRKILGDNPSELQKNEVLAGIYGQKELFEQMFLDEDDETSEDYDDVCVGAINENIIDELALPVKTSGSIDFDEDSAYGLKNGIKHNGVDLGSNAGVKEGADVYAIANGTVESVDSGTARATSGVSNFLFIGDSRYSGISSSLAGLGTQNQVFSVVASTPEQWKDVTANGSGAVSSSSESKTFTFPNEVSGISVMLGVNATNQLTQMESVLQNLHKKYPNAMIYVNSIYHVGKNYTYVNAAKFNEDIDIFNSHMISYCEANQDWLTYIDVTDGLYDADGYCNDVDSEGIHLIDDGKKKLVENIRNNLGSTETLGKTIKIQHTIIKDNKEYKFYSVYSNVDPDSVKFAEGETVQKEDVIALVGKNGEGASELHFEFRNEDDEAIDPTNLFIKCTNGSTNLTGNDNEEKIWNYYVSKGYPKTSVAGIMGNMYYESGFIPTNVQNAGAGDDPEWDLQYTADVDSGKISRDEFANNGPNGGGYGLVQFTYPYYKGLLYDKHVNENKSIGDLGLQLDYTIDMFNIGEFSGLHADLQNSNLSIRDVASSFLHNYERPAGHDTYNKESKERERSEKAQEIYDRYANKN